MDLSNYSVDTVKTVSFTTPQGDKLNLSRSELKAYKDNLVAQLQQLAYMANDTDVVNQLGDVSEVLEVKTIGDYFNREP